MYMKIEKYKKEIKERIWEKYESYKNEVIDKLLDEAAPTKE